MKFKPNKLPNRMLCFEIKPEGVAMAMVEVKRNAKAVIHANAWVETTKFTVKTINTLINDYNLKDWPVTIILPEEQYQMRLVEIPDVGDSDAMEAVKLKASDFITYPIDDALVDVIKMPEKAFHGRRKMAFVVITESEPVLRVVDVIKQAGLSVHSVDVADLALRNLSTYCNHNPYSGVLLIAWQHSQINLCHFQDLVVNRRIDIGSLGLLAEDQTKNDQLTDKVQHDSLMLEMQRSMDYFESQLGLGVIDEICVLSFMELPDSIYDILDRNFNTNIHKVKIDELFELGKNSEVNMLDQCFVAIGGALRYQGAGG
ncbi:MAG: pilus assembly protein PilM [Saccharospirillaceae bacterium]|nr:hypothetical protein [Pseudomonadales bacterium]NRB77056.1 pilus assembly protein PilM [Saccharospirillaceae bacterium]